VRIRIYQRDLRACVSALALIPIIVGACAPSTGVDTPAPGTSQERPSGLQAVLVTSQVLVGQQRLAIGVLDKNTPINDARVRVRVYRASPSDPLANEADAVFKGEGLEGAGAYVAYVRFGATGSWIAQVSAQRVAGQASTTLLPVNVVTTGNVPAPGRPAPRSKNLTRRDVPDLSYIDSGVPPDDMHDLSIADAIAQRRPALIVFATPAFCTSRMCGPEVQAVQQLEPGYRDRIAFIHVEIYQDFKQDPNKMTLTPTVLEWRLQTEPWVFLIDANGIVRYAFEGPTASDELRAALDVMLAQR
jgi:hypothetical protein